VPRLLASRALSVMNPNPLEPHDNREQGSSFMAGAHPRPAPKTGAKLGYSRRARSPSRRRIEMGTCL